MTKQEIMAFHQGMREGYARFAWWSNGTQYVGTSGKTLKQALQESLLEESQDLAKLED